MAETLSSPFTPLIISFMLALQSYLQVTYIGQPRMVDQCAISIILVPFARLMKVRIMYAFTILFLLI